MPEHQLRDIRWEAQRNADDVLLYQCVNGHPDMSWGDIDDVYFYIPAAALRGARDFSQVFVHCGE